MNERDSDDVELAADTDVTDAELWSDAVAGNPESFGVIFDRHALAVHRYCGQRLGSSDLADDLVSVVFLEAWRHRDRVELLSDSALPWLLGVARNAIKMKARALARHRAALGRLPQQLSEPDHADSVAEGLDSERRLASVARALHRLRPLDQDVIALCVWQKLDYAAASIALGIPIGTVKSRLARARRRLAELVEADESTSSALAFPFFESLEELS